MDVFSQIIKSEDFEHDFDFLQSLLKEKVSKNVIYFKIEKKDTYFRVKKELSHVKKIEPANSLIILIAEFPGPKWIKKFPRLTDNFINLHLST